MDGWMGERGIADGGFLIAVRGTDFPRDTYLLGVGCDRGEGGFSFSRSGFVMRTHN